MIALSCEVALDAGCKSEGVSKTTMCPCQLAGVLGLTHRHPGYNDHAPSSRCDDLLHGGGRQ